MTPDQLKQLLDSLQPGDLVAPLGGKIIKRTESGYEIGKRAYTVDIVTEHRAAVSVSQRREHPAGGVGMARGGWLLASGAVRVSAGGVYCAEFSDLCARMPDASADMILCDLPYGTTACAWDSIIPFDVVWTAFKRIIKPRGAIVLTASQPFTSALVMSNPAWFRHEWVWEKDTATGHLNARRAPLKAHETALVFGDGSVEYNPVLSAGEPYRATRGAAGGYVRDKSTANHLTVNDGFRFPRSVLKFNSDPDTVHPTQKPVALFEYLIRTYTQPGELVFDPCVGSGTTAVAARLAGREFIVGDQDAGYCEIARQRVASIYSEREQASQIEMFTERAS